MPLNHGRAWLHGGEASDDYPASRMTKELRRALTAGQPEWLAGQMTEVGGELPRNLVLTEAQVKWLAARLPGDAAAAEHLKFGYFRQSLPGQWPHGEALAFLAAEQSKEAAGDARWLFLGGIIAYGRAVVPPYSDWQAAYRALAGQSESLARFPALLASIAIDYAMVAPPGAQRRTRAAAGEVRYFIENMFPRWLALPDEDGDMESIPDWAGLARAYKAENLLWKLAAEMEKEPGEEIPFRLRLAELAMSKVVENGGGRVSFAPERARPHLLAIHGRDDFPRLPTRRQVETLSLLAEVHQAKGDWDGALDYYAAAAEAGASRVMAARCAYEAWRATMATSNSRGAERYRSRLLTELSLLMSDQSLPDDQLAAARLAMEIDGQRGEGLAVLDRLLAREDVPDGLRRQAALSRLAAAARDADSAAGRLAVFVLDSLKGGRPLSPLDALLAGAYRNKLNL